MAEESLVLPRNSGFLLQNSANMRIRGICSKGEDSRRNRMIERNAQRQGRFAERGMHLRSPMKSTCGGCRICEVIEDLGNCRKETAVKVEHAKEFLQRLNSVGGGKKRMVEHGMGL